MLNIKIEKKHVNYIYVSNCNGLILVIYYQNSSIKKNAKKKSS